MSNYERMTPVDSNALFNEFTQPLSENKSIQYALRLQELENAIENGDLRFAKYPTKYNMGDIVWHRDLTPKYIDGSWTQRMEPHEWKVVRVNYNKKGATYAIRNSYGKILTTDERYLFATKEEALGK